MQLYEHAAFVANLPLREAFAPPILDHSAVVATWKEGFDVVLAQCSNDDLAVLTKTATRKQIRDLVQKRNGTLIGIGSSKRCPHTSVSEELCLRCEKEFAIIQYMRDELIAESNLNPHDALGLDNNERIGAYFLAVMAENGSCKKCHEREYVACLCTLDALPGGRNERILRDWSKKNISLQVDISFYHRYLDFMMRHVEYESCLVCPERPHNLQLPPNKRICFCDQVRRCLLPALISLLTWNRVLGVCTSPDSSRRTSAPA